MFFFLFKFAPDRYKTLEMCNRVVSEDPFLIVYCPDIYITKKKCDDSVDDCSTKTYSLLVCYK